MAIQVNKIRYYAKVAGSRFCFEDGTEVYFNYGFADIPVTDEKHIKELNAILGKQPNIWLPDAQAEALPIVGQNAKAEAEIAAGDASVAGLKNVRVQQESGGVNVATGTPSNPEGSTLDPTLRQGVFPPMSVEPAKIGPGAASSKLEAIRAAASGNVVTPAGN